jgi:hypothetical protein
MKRILVSLVILGMMAGGEAQAHFMPFPSLAVLGQAVDALPSGFLTVVTRNDVYYYAKGIFYQKIVLLNKYVVVPPPVGETISEIPQAYQLMMVDGATYYEYAGVYYVRVLDGYRIIEPPSL